MSHKMKMVDEGKLRSYAVSLASAAAGPALLYAILGLRLPAWFMLGLCMGIVVSEATRRWVTYLSPEVKEVPPWR